jgi:hypothetical protein
MRHSGVVIKQEHCVTDERQRLPREIADGFSDRAVDLADIVVDARQQRTSRAAREERRRLIEQMPKQLVAQSHHDPMAEIVHQVTREVAAESLEEIRDDNRHRHELQRGLRLRLQHIVDDRFDQPCLRGGRRPINQHRHHGAGNQEAVGSRVTKQAQEWVHQVD